MEQRKRHNLIYYDKMVSNGVSPMYLITSVLSKYNRYRIRGDFSV